ncbi:MAG: CYTH domain-containing protein [Candidatus Staskawiczbacteria bacterium]|nr:CYTH domain-containing protein [Candidatus Staskawiczbacteria bacterium]
MAIEYEATFLNINKGEIREKLEKVGAKLVKSEFMQKRVVFNLPNGHEIEGAWLRVRDEDNKITMSLKVVDGEKIENQKEIGLVINDFNAGKEFLEVIGCQKKSYQETKREIWELDGVEVCIDEWPFLEPFVEVEGKSEKEVKLISEKLGFDYFKALFCAAGEIYSKKYGIPAEIINNKTPEITFNMGNPFLKNNYKINL